MRARAVRRLALDREPEEGPSGIPPLEAALAVFAAAALGLGAWMLWLIRVEIGASLLPWWPLLAGLNFVAWVTQDSWAPWEASRPRSVATLVLFVALLPVALLPLAALAWEVGGATLVAGAALAALLCVVAMVVLALLKPTSELQPVDVVVLIGVTVGVTLLVTLGLGLPPKLTWGVPLIGVVGLFFLDTIDDVCVTVSRGSEVTAGVRLLLAASVLFEEFLFAFVRQLG